MATNVLSPLTLDCDLTLVLAAYSAAQPIVATELDDDEAVGWVPRLPIVDHVSAERLAPVHGKLIALGLLRFQLLDRTGGMVYRLSPEGRSALATALGKDDSPPAEATDDADEAAATRDVAPENAERAVETAA